MMVPRLGILAGMIVLSVLALEADAMLSSRDGVEAMMVPEPSVVLMLFLAVAVAFVAATVMTARGPVPVRRRRVNRARLRARRAARA